MKIVPIVLFPIAAYWNGLLAQDSIVVISRLSNTQIVQQDSIVVVSTLGHFPGGIYEQNGLVISFEPFTFLFDGSTTALHDLPQIAGLKVYPNPVSEYAILARDDAGEAFRIRVFNSDGRLILGQLWPAGSNSSQISFAEYLSGVYFLSVSDTKLTKASHYKILRQ